MSKLFIAGEVFHGAGTLSELANIKGTKAIIVTGGSSMRKSGTLDKAVDYLTKACNLEHSKACYNLAIKYQNEDGVEKNPLKAAQLSFEKYCSVSKTLEPQVEVVFSVWVNNQEVIL